VLRLAEATPEALAERIADVPALLLPIGTIEYHGRHLPLGLDGLKAEAIAEEAGRASGAVVAPTNWWAADGVPQPYTLRLPADAVQPLLEESLLQFAGIGFRAICLVNGHFGLENSRLLRRVALRVMARGSVSIVPVADYEVLLGLGDRADHAGRWETSLLLAARPELVDLTHVPASGPVDGVIGESPHDSNAEEGRAGIAAAGERIGLALRRALDWTETARSAYTTALEAGLAALDALAELRSELPREQVPPVLTPSWEAHLRALDQGELALARDWAERKRADPAS
jgi:creatinine amidohydrolase